MDMGKILVFFMLATGSSFALGTIAHAEAAPEYKSAVGTFQSICLTGGVEPSARPAALAEAEGWREDSAPTIDVEKLEISKTISKNYSFRKPAAVRHWTGIVDGAAARIVLANFDAKQRYPHLCALIMEDVRNAMPYHDELKSAFKEFGIGGKSVDLVHYFEYAGKVGSDKHPVRGEIFSRSLATPGKQIMHIYVAY